MHQVCLNSTAHIQDIHQMCSKYYSLCTGNAPIFFKYYIKCTGHTPSRFKIPQLIYKAYTTCVYRTYTKCVQNTTAYIQDIQSQIVKPLRLTFTIKLYPGNTKGGSITVPLTSHLTGLESAV